MTHGTVALISGLFDLSGGIFVFIKMIYDSNLGIRLVLRNGYGGIIYCSRDFGIFYPSESILILNDSVCRPFQHKNCYNSVGFENGKSTFPLLRSRLYRWISHVIGDDFPFHDHY